MQPPRHRPILPIRTYETRQRNRTAICEKEGDLGDAADVLIAIGLGEAEIAVQAEADVVAVEAVGGEGGVQQVLLEGGGDGGFAGGGEAGEPDCEAGLGAEGGALGVG